MLPWLAELGLITVATVAPSSFSAVGLSVKRTYPKVGSFPAPSNYTATAIIFGPLALLSDTAKFGRIASAAGWALVLATLLGVLDPVDPLNSMAATTSTAPATTATAAATPSSAGPRAR